MALVYSLNAGGTSYSVASFSCEAGAVTIPNTYNGLPVTNIGESAFRTCTDITSIIIPNSVTSIEGQAFDNCTNLVSITIPDTVTSIGAGAFFNCYSLTSVNIPNGVTSINAQTFWLCSSLTKMIIPNSVTNFGYGAFAYCSALTDVIIGNNVLSIQDFTFYNCFSLIKINFLGNAPTLGTDVFVGNPVDLKIYRKKNFVTGWTSTFGGKPVVLISDNVVKSGGSGKLTTKKRYLYIATGIGLSPNINGLRFYLSGINALGHLSFRDETNTYELYYTPFGAQFAIRPLPFSIVTPPSRGWTKGSSSNPTDPPTGNYTQSAGGYAGVVTISEYFK